MVDSAKFNEVHAAIVRYIDDMIDGEVVDFVE